MDPKGIINTWNVGAERIKGYQEEEIVGQYYGVLFTEEDQKKGEPEREIELTKKHGKHEAEWWRRRKDGTLFWASIVLTAVYDDEDELIGFTKVTKDLTYRKAHEDVLQKKSDDLAKVNKDLDHFIYIASHDLKAPILNLEALTRLLMNEVEKIGSFNTKVIEIQKHI
ncbi:PAS domain S-box protein [Pontibacter sp. XAAS-A31]|nr:PAS domain S-box protein [Pontibacter harenae]